MPLRTRRLAGTERSLLEPQADAAVDHPAFERRPGVDGPAAIDGAVRQQNWTVVGLPYVRQVLAVDEEAPRAESRCDPTTEAVEGWDESRHSKTDNYDGPSENQLVVYEASQS